MNKKKINKLLYIFLLFNIFNILLNFFKTKENINISLRSFYYFL